MSAPVITPVPGMIVSFDDPWDGTGARFVAAYIPGTITADGELIDLQWTDSYGGNWQWADIIANNPVVHTPVPAVEQENAHV